MGDVLGNLVWVLPRPRQPYYKGGFPLHFEKRLWRLLGKPHMILHTFGGLAEHGIRIDLKRETKPTIRADAHRLPFRNDTFDAVICDPPYSAEENKKLYDLETPLRYNEWVREAERVLKPRGFIVLYHDRWLPKPKSCSYWMRILLLVSQHHRARVVGIFQKDDEQTNNVGRGR